MKKLTGNVRCQAELVEAISVGQSGTVPASESNICTVGCQPDVILSLSKGVGRLLTADCRLSPVI